MTDLNLEAKAEALKNLLGDTKKVIEDGLEGSDKQRLTKPQVLANSDEVLGDIDRALRDMPSGDVITWATQVAIWDEIKDDPLS